MIATFWVGSIWTIGYLVAPTLFGTLSDRVLAGTIAGSLFRIEAWVSVVCAIAMFALTWFSSNQVSEQSGVASRKTRLVLIAAILGCTLVGYFALHPFMAALRENAVNGVMSADARMQFGILHGISSGIYLIQSVLGGILVLKLR